MARIAGGGGVAGSVGGAGEFALVARITERLSQGAGVLVGPGDDAALVAAPDGRVVATTDAMIEGRHFRRAWSSAADVGHRAAARSLADVAAMGAVPTALLVALAAPPDLPAEWVLELADGLREEAALVGASVVGGDTSRDETLHLVVTALGTCEGRDPVLRSGARPGDVVAVAGRLGWAEGGLAALTRGFRSPRVLVEAHRRPQPPYAMGPAAARLGATSMIDVSDGLVADLGHVAAASDVLVALRSEAFGELPPPLRDASSALGVDPLRWLLTGGDDHALAATFPAGTDPGEGWTVVGEVRDAGAGQAVVTVDGAPWDGPGGHRHFESSRG